MRLVWHPAISMDDNPDEPAFYTPSEIVKQWGVTAATVRACICSGALEAFRVGPRLIRVRADKLAECEARKAAEAARLRGRDAMMAEEREAERARDRELTVMIRAVRDAGKRQKARDEVRRAK